MMISNLSKDENLWKTRRVFITGATGLVGSWLIKELLSKGAYLVALVRDADPQSELSRSGNIQQISVVSGSLEEYASLERAINEHEVDTIFHLAAQPLVGVAYRSPLATFEANIRGSYNLLEACRVHYKFVKRVVVASSDKAYGEQPELPYTEDMPLQGRYPYEASKSCSDLIAQTYFHTYKLPVAIARCGNIYGGGDLNWSRIVPGTIRSLLLGEQPAVRSDGTFVRDYIYVKDVAQAFMRLAECLDSPEVQGEAFNFSPERAVTVLEVVSHIQRLMESEHLTPVIQNISEGEIHSQYLSSSKARRILDWQPKYSLDNGLRETVQWYREFFSINLDRVRN